MTKQYQRNPNTRCIVCQKPIYKRPSVIKANNNKAYCSQKCYGVSCRKEIPCSICGKPILAGLNKKTCSHKCANISRKGIKYTGKQLKNKVVAYLSQRSRLIKLYGNECQKCRYNKYNILQIHHVDKNHNNNDQKNLLLLCPNCHAEAHLKTN